MSTLTPIVPTRTPIDIPTENPTARLGERLPAEGENGLFSQSWFPVCLSSEIAPGQIRGEPFLDGKVVAYRGEDGVARVMSAYCPHVGADLSLGCVVGQGLRCAFHKWEYDSQGRCHKTWVGDAAPRVARLYKFPVQERYGIVWAFNGDKPFWDIPDFQFADEQLAIRVFRSPEVVNCDPWIFCANTPDMQHFKVVHKVQFKIPDPHHDYEWHEWGFRYRCIATHQEDVPIDWWLGIRGTTLYWQEGMFGDFWLGAMVGFAIPAPGQHRLFAIVAVEKGDGSPQAEALQEERFARAEHLMYRTVGEDHDILDTIRYRPGALTKGDTSLARYLDILRKFPRAHPSGPFIR
jgi:nitrite reductase/ring-hydroxylating ferredoxin subunit